MPETDAEHLKRVRKQAARRLQKETGEKYIKCLRMVIELEGGELDDSGAHGPPGQGD